MRTLLPIRRMLLLLAAAGLLPLPAAAEIVPTKENGRVIYVDSAPKSVAKRSSKPRRHSVLVYWSRSEQRWKPVPPPTPSAVRAARWAAADVRRYLAQAPQAEQPAADPAASPDNREIIGSRAVSSADLDRIIEEAAQRHGVDANLVRAVVKVESGGNPRAVSRKGAMGLMQLMPGTARQLNVSNPFDPQQNVDAGVRHLRGLLDNYGGDVTLSVAAYNAGAGAVDRNGGVPPYRETRDYVKKIQRLYGQDKVIGTGSAPMRVYRDERGVLIATNTD